MFLHLPIPKIERIEKQIDQFQSAGCREDIVVFLDRKNEIHAATPPGATVGPGICAIRIHPNKTPTPLPACEGLLTREEN